MIALAIPTWGRLEFTKICLDTFKKYTNFNLVTKVKIYDNSSGHEMEDLIKSSGFDYVVGKYNSAWAGFNELQQEVKNDNTIQYIGKVDNDVSFTCDWIELIVNEFNNDATIGSIRYAFSASNGTTSSLVKEGGFDGGLKIFKKDLVVHIPSFGGRYSGSNAISKHIAKSGYTNDSMEVGVDMLPPKFINLSSRYKSHGLQRI